MSCPAVEEWEKSDGGKVHDGSVVGSGGGGGGGGDGGGGGGGAQERWDNRHSRCR